MSELHLADCLDPVQVSALAIDNFTPRSAPSQERAHSVYELRGSPPHVVQVIPVTPPHPP